MGRREDLERERAELADELTRGDVGPERRERIRDRLDAIARQMPFLIAADELDPEGAEEGGEPDSD